MNLKITENQRIELIITIEENLVGMCYPKREAKLNRILKRLRSSVRECKQ